MTVGRGELLLSLLAVALLCILAGFLGGQLSKMIRQPKPIKLRPMTPEDEERGRKMLREMCPGPHCDDRLQLGAWMRSKGFSLITNEMLTALQDEARIQRFEWPTGADAADSPEVTKWPGGDPDAV